MLKMKGIKLHKEIESFKKEMGIEKIAGIMMIHYFMWPWCLKELSNYVDEIYLLLHYSPRFKATWPKSFPKVKGCFEVTKDQEWQVMEWRENQGMFREKILRMLDNVKPGLVFFPDEDESFPEPEYLVKNLVRFYSSNKKQLAFKRCNFWDSMETVRKDKWIKYYPHVKIFKWENNLTYLPYIGFNCVTSYGKRKMVAKTVIKHYAYLYKKERERRFNELYKEKQKTFQGLLKKPKLVKYVDPIHAPRT